MNSRSDDKKRHSQSDKIRRSDWISDRWRATLGHSV